jgi:hypothetical protein
MSIETIAAIARGTPGLCPDHEAMCAWLAGEPMAWLDDAKVRAWGSAGLVIVGVQ